MASTRRSTRIATANNRPAKTSVPRFQNLCGLDEASSTSVAVHREVRVKPLQEKAPKPPGKRAARKDANPAETRARVAKAPEASAAPNAPAATRGRVAEGQAEESPEHVLTHGAERQNVISFEPFIKDSLREMLDEKVRRGVRTFVDVAKTDENGERAVDEAWLGGAPLARNCEPPRDTSSGRVGIALCTYNCGTANGASGTLGRTPFALQKDGFPANLSMRFLMCTIPKLVWHTNKTALHDRYRGWRDFTDAHNERFGMFDLISIALPKVSGVTIALIKFMKARDKDTFELWVLATAAYFATFLRLCGGASNVSAVINASGRLPSNNPWLLYLRELKTIAPEHAVVSFLQGVVERDNIMPHASAIINGKVKIGVETLRRGDEALTRIFSAMFVDEMNALAVHAAVCHDWKLDRDNAHETMESFRRKEKAQMRQVEEAAAKAAAKAKRKARDSTPAAKAKKKALDEAEDEL